MIGGILKSYPNFTLDYVLYDMSYRNLILYSSIIPSYDFDKKKDKADKKINASDPRNREEARSLLGKKR